MDGGGFVVDEFHGEALGDAGGLDGGGDGVACACELLRQSVVAAEVRWPARDHLRVVNRNRRAVSATRRFAGHSGIRKEDG